MTSSSEAATQTDDIDARLRELVARGFQFIPPRDADGEVVALIGVRGHDDVIDVVQICSEDDVVATRMPSDEEDVFAPSTVTWQTMGPAADVLADLLALPDRPGTASSRLHVVARSWTPSTG